MLPKPFVGGFGIVSNDGIPKPNFWGFRMLRQLYPKRLSLGDTDPLDCGAFSDGQNVQLLITPQSVDPSENHQFDASISLDFEAENVTVQRIDDTHCNPKRLWQEQGSPDNLTKKQVEEIQEQSRLQEEPLPFRKHDGQTEINVSLRTNDVLLITAYSGS